MTKIQHLTANASSFYGTRTHADSTPKISPVPNSGPFVSRRSTPAGKNVAHENAELLLSSNAIIRTEPQAHSNHVSAISLKFVRLYACPVAMPYLHNRRRTTTFYYPLSRCLSLFMLYTTVMPSVQNRARTNSLSPLFSSFSLVCLSLQCMSVRYVQ